MKMNHDDTPQQIDMHLEEHVKDNIFDTSCQQCQTELFRLLESGIANGLGVQLKLVDKDA